MKNIKLRIATVLLLLSCLVGLGTNVTGTIFPQTATVTAQAAGLSASQKRQIARINSRLSKAQKNAKNWIAYRESGYRYNARNGRCYGRYQLLRSYLHGNLSPVNQESRANQYVASRYGSWTNAKRFWQHHHWY